MHAQRKQILEQAIKANKQRAYFSFYPENIKAYNEELITKGSEIFNNRLGAYFKEVVFGKNVEWIGEEISPYTQQMLNIKYPAKPINELVKTACDLSFELKQIPIDIKADIIFDVLEELKNSFFEMAYATMHTTGQSFLMAFQASGPHANDRGLECLAMAYEELTRYESQVKWEKPIGKNVIKLNKQFKAIPKGPALVIGCSTFTVWNSLPGIIANFMAGNTIIVKPHPKAVLPLAIVVAAFQKVLIAHKFSPQLVQLAVDSSSNPITLKLAENNSIKVIDYTGNSAFGNVLEKLENKTVFTEKSAINSIIIDSVVDLNSVLENIIFSVSLYCGQMCTSPQNIFIPEGGIKTPERTIGYQETVTLFLEKLQAFYKNPKVGAGTLATLNNQKPILHINNFKAINATILAKPEKLAYTDFPKANCYTHVVIETTSNNMAVIEQENFGPFITIIKTKGIDESILLAKQNALNNGAITCLAYCTNQKIKQKIMHEMEDAFTPVTFNLTGYFWVNQHAAFSDFHVSGNNKSGNATFTDANFINKRFVWLGHREMV